MKKRLVISRFLILIAWVSIGCLHSAPIKQVRVIADRATIYSEPAPTSARIDVVEKGTVLTLFQQNKVRDVWYYVSFQSPRYGARISGFVHESAVEPVAEEITPPPKKEQAEPKKLGPPPAKALRAAPKAEEKKEIKVEPLALPRVEELIVPSRLPKSEVIKLPRQVPQLKEAVWKPIPTVPTAELSEKKEDRVKELKPIILIELVAAIPLPRSRPVKLPGKEKAREDRAWKIIPLIAEEKKAQKEKAPPKKAEPLPLPFPPAGKEEAKEKPPAVAPAKTPVTPTAPVQLPSGETRSRGRGLLTLGLGYGPSLGGAGVFLQLNTKAGFALHGGVGYYPTTLIYSETDWVKNTIFYSVGIKYYLPFKSSLLSPYLDLQYGGLRVEAAQMVLGVWEYTYVLGHEQKALWGPSALAGAELRMGRFGINGAVGVSYALTEWEYLEQKTSFSFDLSFLVYF